MENYLEAPIEPTPEQQQQFSLFVAGGISDCADWQKQFCERLLKSTNLLIFNPRRNDFDVSKHENTIQQIIWEHKRLREAHCISFWFPKETLCPITLFEYGYWLSERKSTGKKIVVGCDPEYSRLLDVQIQTHLVDPSITIHSKLEDLYQEIVAYNDDLLALRA